MAKPEFDPTILMPNSVLAQQFKYRCGAKQKVTALTVKRQAKGIPLLIAATDLDKFRASGDKMKLNHLHISVPNAKEAAEFYEKFFGFKFAFSEDDGKMIFLRDSSRFLLALHDLAPEETVNLPPWHHFGFCVESKDRVKQIYTELKSAGVQFARDLRVEETWANFYCWAPGPYRVEVSWDQGEQ